MILKNDTNRYLLYYLFLNDIRNDKYHGLSHVVKHTFWNPSFPVASKNSP